MLRLIRHAQAVRRHHGADFRPEFFPRVRLRSEAVLDALVKTLPVHSIRVSGAVADLMEHGLVIAFRVLELGPLGQHNLVARHVVIGPIPVDFADRDPVCRNDVLDVL